MSFAVGYETDDNCVVSDYLASPFQFLPPRIKGVVAVVVVFVVAVVVVFVVVIVVLVVLVVVVLVVVVMVLSN